MFGRSNAPVTTSARVGKDFAGMHADALLVEMHDALLQALPVIR